MSSGFTVSYTYPHTGFSKDVYWSLDLDEAREYAQMIVRNQGSQVKVELASDDYVIERWHAVKRKRA